eukprot:g3904.t1
MDDLDTENVDEKGPPPIRVEEESPPPLSFNNETLREEYESALPSPSREASNVLSSAVRLGIDLSASERLSKTADVSLRVGTAPAALEQQQKKHVENEIGYLREEILAARKELAAKDQIKEGLVIQLAASNEKYEQQLDDIAALEEMTLKQDAELEALRERVKILTNESNTNLENDESKQKELLASLSSNLSAGSRALPGMSVNSVTDPYLENANEEELMELNSEITELRDELFALQSDLANEKESRSILETQLEQARTEIESERAKVTRIGEKRKSEAEAEAMATKLLREQLKSAETQLKSLRESRRGDSSKIETQLQNVLEAKEDTINKLKEEIDQYKANIKNLSVLGNDNDDEIRKLQAENESLSLQNLALEGEKETLQKKLEKKTETEMSNSSQKDDELDHALAEITQTKVELTLLKEQLDRERKMVKELESDKFDLEKEVQKLKTNRDSLPTPPSSSAPQMHVVDEQKGKDSATPPKRPRSPSQIKRSENIHKMAEAKKKQATSNKSLPAPPPPNRKLEKKQKKKKKKPKILSPPPPLPPPTLPTSSEKKLPSLPADIPPPLPEKSKSNVVPDLILNIEISDGVSGELKVHPNESPEKATDRFIAEYKLDPAIRGHIITYVKNQLENESSFDVPVDIDKDDGKMSGVDRLELDISHDGKTLTIISEPGDNPGDLATKFIEEHGMDPSIHAEIKAYIAAQMKEHNLL